MSSSRSSPAGSHRGQRGTVGPHVRRRPAPHVPRDRTVHLEGFGISELGFCNSQVVDLFFGGGGGGGLVFWGFFLFFFFTSSRLCSEGTTWSREPPGVACGEQSPTAQGEGSASPRSPPRCTEYFCTRFPPHPGLSGSPHSRGGGWGCTVLCKTTIKRTISQPV